jgi:hypothetical protein
MNRGGKGMELQLPEGSADTDSIDTQFCPEDVADALQFWMQEAIYSHTPTYHLPLHRAVNISMEEVDYHNPKGFEDTSESNGQESFIPVKPNVERVMCCRESSHHHSRKNHQMLSHPSGHNTVEYGSERTKLHLVPLLAEHLGVENSSTAPNSISSGSSSEDKAASYVKKFNKEAKDVFQIGRGLLDSELAAVAEGRHEMLRRQGPQDRHHLEVKPLAPIPIHAHNLPPLHDFLHRGHAPSRPDSSTSSFSPRGQGGRKSAFTSPALPPSQTTWTPAADFDEYFVEDHDHHHIHYPPSESPCTEVSDHDNNEDSQLPFCPERPFSLVRTNFAIHLKPSACAWDLIQLIHQCLGNFVQYDFSFIEKSTLWKGKYIRGSQCCVIYINLYCELEKSNSFIIEVVKVYGDSKPFCEFFREFRALMTQYQPTPVGEAGVLKPSATPNSGYSPKANVESSNVIQPQHSQPWGAESPGFVSPFPSPINGMAKWKTNMSKEELLVKIEPICKLESSPYYEVKLEAAKMLADLSHLDPHTLTDEHSMREILRILENLIVCSGFAMVKEQAIIALASFVEIPGYASALLQQSEVIPMLLSFVSNPCDMKKAYETAQLRRECARILEQLVAYDAREFKRYLERRNLSLQIWLERVDDIEDLRTRLSAKRTKHTLMVKCFPQARENGSLLSCFTSSPSKTALSLSSPSIAAFPFSPTGQHQYKHATATPVKSTL